MSDQPNHASDPIDAEFEPAENPETASLDYEKPAKSSRGPGWISLTLVLFIALGALGVSVWSSGLLTQTSLPSPTETSLADLRQDQQEIDQRIADFAAQLEGTIDRVDSEIERLETDLAAVETAPAAMPELPEDAAAFDARLASLEDQLTQLTEAQEGAVSPARIEAIETALQSATTQTGGASDAQLVSLKAELETLRADLTALQSTQETLTSEVSEARSDAQNMSRASAQILGASLALDAIEASAARGEAFPEEYKQLQDTRPDDPDVTALAGLSKIAIPTMGELKSSFSRLRNDALARDTEEGSGLGWVNTVFGESVSVRRSASGSESANLITDAQAALARDDLMVAIDSIEALPANTKAVFQTWLADARRRARLEDSLETLRLKLISAGQEG
ncbi:hypothetical protein WNY37_01175 [Henriciella sp. AS95]|uniref:hypothetical protein n=1 Tax=Henriciella sp. AS95 TaxID=3135782 RepID=UPI0031822D68